MQVGRDCAACGGVPVLFKSAMCAVGWMLNLIRPYGAKIWERSNMIGARASVERTCGYDKRCSVAISMHEPPPSVADSV